MPLLATPQFFFSEILRAPSLADGAVVIGAKGARRQADHPAIAVVDITQQPHFRLDLQIVRPLRETDRLMAQRVGRQKATGTLGKIEGENGLRRYGLLDLDRDKITGLASLLQMTGEISGHTQTDDGTIGHCDSLPCWLRMNECPSLAVVARASTAQPFLLPVGWYS